MARRSFRLAPLQADWVRARFAVSDEQLLREMRILTPDGKVFGGAEALVELSRTFWWARWLAEATPTRGAGRAFTGAATGFRSGGVVRWFDFLPLVVLPVTAAGATRNAPAWLLMWSVAGALFVGLKWLAWRDGATGSAGVWRSAGFFALWPGMDARRFLAATPGAFPARRAEWAAALFKTSLGGVTVWLLARIAFAVSPLIAGWVGMIGLALGLHFGLFHLLSLAWRAAGVNASPIMDAPLRATSLAEFWGRRWNLGFSVPARRFLLKPFAVRVGNLTATFAVFLVSGILHELVISFPARAGYGLPTAYFAVQGVAMLVERSAFGRGLGLGTGWRGWLFTFLCAAGPVFWLFHPPFVHRVILPFLQAIGAISKSL